MNKYGAGTNVGNVRDNNEDSYVCDAEKELWIVADGMGGLGFGEVASAITTYTVTTLVREGHGVNQAIELAHRNIKEYAQSDGMGTNMGTTIVLLLSSGSLYNVFWVGDSRAYLFDNTLSQVTTDHSLVQSLIDQGELTEEEAETDPRKNAVTRALGVQELETVRADSISERWRPNQKILLCSDGLTDCVSNSDIEAIIGSGKDDQTIVDELIEAALEGGGKDNVTVVLVSAPDTISHGDSDTHVPDTLSRGDDTHVPDASANSEPGGTIARSTTQLQLPLSSPAPAETVPGRADKTSPLRLGYRYWKASLATAATVLLGVLFLLPDPADATSMNLQAAFAENPTLPPHGTELPVVEIPQQGIVLQVGLFSRLEGAEIRLTQLTEIGMTPHIKKRMSPEGLRYAVLIGPIEPVQHNQVLAALEENRLSYFHWQPQT